MTQPMPADTAYAISGMQPLEVDINSLSDFANALRMEVDINLRPAWERISALLDRPRFGNSAELDLGQKRATYDAYLQEARTFFQNVITGTAQMAEAAEQIAANYSQTDQFNAIRLDDVNAALPNIQGQVAREQADRRGI